MLGRGSSIPIQYSFRSNNYREGKISRNSQTDGLVSSPMPIRAEDALPEAGGFRQSHIVSAVVNGGGGIGGVYRGKTPDYRGIGPIHLNIYSCSVIRRNLWPLISAN